MVSIFTVLILDLSFSLHYHTAQQEQAMPHTYTVPLQTLSFHQGFEATRNFLAFATFLILPKTQIKNLNSEACINRSYSTRTSVIDHSSLPSTITLWLSKMIPSSKHLKKNPTITFRSSFDFLYNTKSYAYNRAGNLHSLTSSRDITPILPISILSI